MRMTDLERYVKSAIGDVEIPDYEDEEGHCEKARGRVQGWRDGQEWTGVREGELESRPPTTLIARGKRSNQEATRVI
jgi:hypothetical protein